MNYPARPAVRMGMRAFLFRVLSVLRRLWVSAGVKVLVLIVWVR
jgi:hypothetical protein